MDVKIYTQTSLKAACLLDGKGIYTLSAMTSKGQADVTRIVDITSTANGAAIIIINKALEHVNPWRSVDIYTESVFVGNALENGWVQRWEAQEWKNQKGEEIAHREEWEQLLDLLDGREYAVHTKEQHDFKNWQETQLKVAGKRGEQHVR